MILYGQPWVQKSTILYVGVSSITEIRNRATMSCCESPTFCIGFFPISSFIALQNDHLEFNWQFIFWVKSKEIGALFEVLPEHEPINGRF